MNKQILWSRPLGWCVLGLALVLSACGGDDDNDAPPPPPSGGQPLGDRIEPLDTALLKQQLHQAVAPVQRRLPAGAPVAEVALGPLSVLKSSVPSAPGQPLQIGVGRELEPTVSAAGLADLLHWQRLADGSQVAALRFVAEGAAGLRLGLQAQAWPEGARLRLQGALDTAVLELPAPDGGVDLSWSPDVEGPWATLELELPPGVDPAALQLAVPQLSHLTQTVSQAVEPRDTTDVGQAGSCHQNAVCTVSDSESRAVAKLLFTDGGSTYLCSGTLLNDSANSQTPHLLTAAHCIDNARAADSLVTYWFFRTAACGSSQIDAAMQRLTGGAQLLQAHYPTDTSLLKLRETPPAGVVYAGSYFGTGVDVGQQVLGLHHPLGDLLKASQGQITSYYNCNSQGWCTGANADNGMLFEVRWSQGTTEGGSSGSALFAGLGGTRYVVGQLHGGNASCQNPGGSDFYGRYGLAFEAGLKRWLWP